MQASANCTPMRTWRLSGAIGGLLYLVGLVVEASAGINVFSYSGTLSMPTPSRPQIYIHASLDNPQTVTDGHGNTYTDRITAIYISRPVFGNAAPIVGASYDGVWTEPYWLPSGIYPYTITAGGLQHQAYNNWIEGHWEESGHWEWSESEQTEVWIVESRWWVDGHYDSGVTTEWREFYTATVTFTISNVQGTSAIVPFNGVTTIAAPGPPKFTINSAMTNPRTVTDYFGNSRTDKIAFIQVFNQSNGWFANVAVNSAAYSGLWTDPRANLAPGVQSYIIDVWAIRYEPYDNGWTGGHWEEEGHWEWSEDEQADVWVVDNSWYVGGYYDAGFLESLEVLPRSEVSFVLTNGQPQVITFPDIGSHSWGEPAFALSATASSGLPVVYSIGSGPASVVGNMISLSGVGPVVVVANQPGNGTFAAAVPVSRSFTVASGQSQTITFGTLPDRVFGDPPFIVTATSSSGLPVSFSVVGGQATASNGTITLTGAGTVTILASQVGNSTFSPAPAISRSFAVGKAPQAITFVPIADVVDGTPSFEPSATASSSLPVEFSIVAGPAIIIQNRVQATGVGTVTVRASQAGDARFAPAPTVDRSFNVALGPNGNLLTVQNGVAGSIGGNANAAIPISTSVPSGQYFAGWTVVSGTGRLADVSSPISTFYMGSTAAVIRANFMPMAPSYAITWNEVNLPNTITAGDPNDANTVIQFSALMTNSGTAPWGPYMGVIVRDQANNVVTYAWPDAMLPGGAVGGTKVPFWFSFWPPSNPGVYTFTFSAAPSIGSATSFGSFTKTITVLPRSGSRPVYTENGGLYYHSHTTGAPLSLSLVATNSPTSYQLNGTLPPGVSFNTSSGQFGGAPSNPGRYAVTVAAANSAGLGIGAVFFTIYEPENYALTVVGGTGGTVTQLIGTPVTITANSPPAGQIFNGWTVLNGPAAIEDRASARTTIMLQSPGNTTVQAGFLTGNPLSVTGGTSAPLGGVPGSVVAIRANPDANGRMFVNWTSHGFGSILNGLLAETSVVMGAGPGNVQANFVPGYRLTPLNGATAAVPGGISGTKIQILSGPTPAGYSFAGWWLSGPGYLISDSSGVEMTMGQGPAFVHPMFMPTAMGFIDTFLIASTPAPYTGQPFTVDAWAIHEKGPNTITEQRIDHSLDGGNTWILGTTAAGTQWIGTPPHHPEPHAWRLTATFAFSEPRVVVFRTMAFEGTTRRSIYGYSRVTVLNVAWDRPPEITSATAHSATVGVPMSPYIITATHSPRFRYLSGALPPGLAFDPIAGIISGTPTAAGTWGVVLMVTNNGGMDEKSLWITVNPTATTILTHPISQVARPGQRVTFRVVAGGSGPHFYQWRKDNVPIAGASYAEYTIPSVTSNHLGTYSVIVTNGSTSVTSNGAALSFALPPIASFTASSSSGQAPLTVNFNGAASSDPNGSIVSYRWDFGDSNPAFGPTASHVFQTAGTQVFYTVRLTVTDNHGASAQSTAVITVNPAPGGTGDSDGDGIPDSAETANGMNPLDASDALLDPDKDGWSSIAEYNRGTQPNSAVSRPYLPAMPTEPDSAWLPPSAPAQYVGHTAGTASVDLSGAAKYTIPIKVTPGSVGMQPRLMLSYSSQGGDGLLGQGWQLQGLPQISRGGSSRAVDGSATGMNFSATDRYFLDGARLVAISGVDGANETEYRTEIDSYSRVVSYGSAGSGPLYFKVWTKGGLVLDMGNSEDSRLKPELRSEALVWGVSAVSDLDGNSMKIEYAASSAEFRPISIGYTRNAAAPDGYATVTFGYTDRLVPQTGYAYDAATTSTKLLSTITVKCGANVFRQYRLVYTQDPGGRAPLLASVQEAADDLTINSKIYPATTFEYAKPALDGFTNASGSGYSFPLMEEVLVADIDGDGLTDVVNVANRNAAWIELHRNDGSGFKLHSDALMLSGADFALNAMLTTDMDGDGRSEVILNPSTLAGQARGTVRQVKWSATANRLAQPFTEIAITGYNDASHWRGWPTYSADFTGDGRDDLLIVALYPPGGPAQMQLLTSQGSYYTATNFSVPQLKNGLIFICDLNGDGKADVLNVGDESSDRRVRAFSIGTNNATLLDPADTVLGAKRVDWRIFPADVNGDGQMDLLYSYKDSSNGSTTENHVEVWTRTGNRFVKTGDQFLGGWNETQFRFVPFDYDGDRKTDIAVVYRPNGGSNARLQLWKPVGPTAAPFVFHEDRELAAAWPAKYSLHPAQLDRDGLGDLLFVSISAKRGWRLHSNRSASEEPGAFPQLLLKATDGLGAMTQFSYLSLLENEIYEPGQGAVWPDVDVRPPFRVVSILEQEQPDGKRGMSEYSYGKLRLNALRGFRGFGWIKRLDSNTGLETTQGYHQAFPFTNLPAFVEVKDSTREGHPMVSRTDYVTRSPVDTDATGKIYRPYLEKSNSVQKDLSGAEVLSRFTKTTLDADGNTTLSYERLAPGLVDMAALEDGQPLAEGQFERRVSVTAFDRNANMPNWLIGRPTRVETYTRSADHPADAATRVLAMAYVAGKKRLQSTTQEPDEGGEAFRIKTEYDYDLYGNLSSVSVSSPGGGPAAVQTRTTLTDYSASPAAPLEHLVAGRFARTTTDALGQQTSFAYDWTSGNLLRRKDEASGLQTTWHYDEFGVQDVETRPDTTTTVTRYRWDSSDIALPNDSSRKARFHVDARTTGASPILTRYSCLGLPLQRVEVGADGASRFAETQYDARGNVALQSRAHLAGSEVYWTINEYDVLNRPKSRSSPGPDSTTASYAWTYSGRTTTETNPRGHQLKRTTNAIGKLAVVQQDAANAVDRGRVTYSYDGFSNVRTAKDANNNTVTTSYDLLGRVTAVDDPNKGTWSYAYYANGEMRTQTDAKGIVTTWVYDKLGREITRTIDTRVVTTTFKINTSPTPVAGARQRDWTAVAENGTEVFRQTWTYDSYSRVNSTTRTIGAKAYTQGFTYDSFSRLKTTSYPTANPGSTTAPVLTTIRSYNSFGFLNAVRKQEPGYPGEDGAGLILWQAVDYEPDGQIRTSYLGNGTAVDRLHYAENGRPSGDAISINPAGNGSIPPQLIQSYSFDGVGNLVGRGSVITPAGGSPITCTETFEYDTMDRLHKVYRSGVSGVAQLYAYDASGNLLTKDGQTYGYTRTILTEPVAPHAVRVAAGVTYSYDANGNLSGDSSGTEVTWTKFNQPDEIKRKSVPAPGTVLESSRFTYGPNDERTTQVAKDTTEVRYVSSQYEVTLPPGGPSQAELRAYVSTPLGRSVVLQFNASGSLIRTSYLAQDQITSVTLVADEAGRITDPYSYDPWGAPRHVETRAALVAWPAQDRTSRGFTDHEMLSKLKLVHMNGRIYDPALGRFLSPDPFVNEADGTQMLNRYAYVRNNPLSLADPTGNLTFDPSLQAPTTTGAGVVTLASVTVTSSLVSGWSTPSWTPLNPSAGLVANTASGTFSYSSVNGFSPNTTMLDSMTVLTGMEAPNRGGAWSFSLDNFRTNGAALLENVLRPITIAEELVREGIVAIAGSAMADGVMRVAVIIPLPIGKLGAGSKAVRLAAAESVGARIVSQGGVVRQFTTEADQVFYRVFSGDKTRGGWLTAVPPRSSAWAQEALALPPGNKAEFIQQVLVPKGTLLERSRAIPVPEWGRFRGGAEQFQLLDEIPPSSFGPGSPLR